LETATPHQEFNLGPSFEYQADDALTTWLCYLSMYTHILAHTLYALHSYTHSIHKHANTQHKNGKAKSSAAKQHWNVFVPLRHLRLVQANPLLCRTSNLQRVLMERDHRT